MNNLVIKFWSKVEKGPNCWKWKGHLNKRSKRGVIWLGNGSCVYASRFSWELHNGSISNNLCVLHKCDNPACVRPDHLFLGTQADNMKDMVSKDRANKPKGELNGRAKLTDNDIRFIRANYRFRDKNYSQKLLAEKFGVCVLTIQEILEGRKWSHVMDTDPSSNRLRNEDGTLFY